MFALVQNIVGADLTSHNR